MSDLNEMACSRREYADDLARQELARLADGDSVRFSKGAAALCMAVTAGWWYRIRTQYDEELDGTVRYFIDDDGVQSFAVCALSQGVVYEQLPLGVSTCPF